MVVGASGYLGAHVYRILAEQGDHEVLGTYGRSSDLHEGLIQVDLTVAESVRKMMVHTRPDVVIWCVKHTSPELDERELNHIGLRSVIDHASPRMRLLFVSTDGVLPGIEGPYPETVQPAPMLTDTPVAQYTNSKLDTEQYILSNWQDSCIVRVGPIYGRSVRGGWDPRMAALHGEFEHNRKVTRAANILRTFVQVEDLAHALAELASHDFQGLLHLGPEKSLSYYELALEVAKAWGYPASLVAPAIVSEAEAQLRHIRMDTTMSVGLAKSLLSTPFRTPEEALSDHGSVFP
jgi:dTDP-4-dehydrorhamnose reductase